MNKLARVNIQDFWGSPIGRSGSSGKNLGDLISLFLSLSFVIAGITFVFILIFGGFKIISSAGQNDPKSTSQGKQAVTTAVAGFIIVITAYMILRFIEFLTGYSLIFTAPNFLG